MKRVPVVITLVTLFAAIYHLAPYIGVSDTAIFIMFLISPILVLYMAYVILKHGRPSGHTFDERYCEDAE